MEQLNSGELKKIFRSISCIVIIGLTTSGQHAWQEVEETRKDTSIVLILQEQLCTSELFKGIQDAVPLILLYFFHIMSDVPSIYIHHQFGIDTGRSKFEQQTDSVLSACGSHGQESQGFCYDRLECTVSCTIHA